MYHSACLSVKIQIMLVQTLTQLVESHYGKKCKLAQLDRICMFIAFQFLRNGNKTVTCKLYFFSLQIIKNVTIASKICTVLQSFG